MEAVNIRENLIKSINTLPSDALEEMYKFLEFLKYKNNENNTKEQILENLKTSARELQMINEGKLKARSASEFLDEL